MADDVDSHIEFWQFPIAATVDDLMAAISRQLLPGVAGPAGWRVYLDIDDLARCRVLGLIYTRDDLGQEDTFCRYAKGSERLANLARGRNSLEVDAVYLTGGAVCPLALHEVTASESVTDSRPMVLGTKAHEYFLTDFRAERKLRLEAKAVAATRRAWIRDHVIHRPSATGEVFVAENLH